MIIRSSRLIDGNSDAERTHRRIRVGCLTRVREGRYTRFLGAEFRSRTHGVSSAQRYGAAFRKLLSWHKRGPKVERRSIVHKNIRECAINANINYTLRPVHAQKCNLFINNSGENRSGRFSGRESKISTHIFQFYLILNSILLIWNIYNFLLYINVRDYIKFS